MPLADHGCWGVTRPGDLVALCGSSNHQNGMYNGAQHHHQRTALQGSKLIPLNRYGVNGIQRTKTTSADIDYLRLLFPACQLVGRKPPWTACCTTQPPHADERSSCRMPPFADPGAALPNKSYTKTRISGQTRLQRAKSAVGDWNAEGTFCL
jgi:hypothetical protein